MCDKYYYVSCKLLGREDQAVLPKLRCLATLSFNQGMLEKAQLLFEQCLELHVTILGPTHPDTLTSMECFAALYMKQGMYDEVEPLYGLCYMIS